MATQVTNYQCPCCTAPLHFSAESGMLECEFCRSSYSPEEIDALYESKNQKAAETVTAAAEKAMQEKLWGKDADDMRAYSCPSCGAELICYHTTAATSCPYCGNPTVVSSQFVDVLRPDYIIPFKQSRENAIDALTNFCKGKLLLPGKFTANNHIKEVKGMYVPFWLFEAKTMADVTFEATRVSSYDDGLKEEITTRHYHVRRVGRVDFENVPVDGSSKMPDDSMDSIEPFDFNGLKPFSMAYLPGFLADRYDVSAQKAFERAEKRMEKSAEDAIVQSLRGYDTAIPVRSEMRVDELKSKYVMLPVWTLHTKYQGKDYLFVMNGQTGKLVGNLPVSWGKALALLAGITAAGTALITALLTLFG